MANVPLTLACGRYDRTQALADGRAAVDGVDLTCLRLPVEEIFFRMLRHGEFEAAEMSLSSYVMTLFTEERPFVAIPVFPSRAFRHSSIYVNADSGIRSPEDLAGRRVGIPEYQMTASVWIRGILAEHHGVPVSSPTYVTGGLEEPNRPEKLKLSLPPEIRIERIGPTETLSQMLADGAIDALYTARQPSTFITAPASVRRLFGDSRAVELEYYRQTSILPIMHTVVLRRDVYEQRPWLAESLAKAFREAKSISYAESYDTAALPLMLPWLAQDIEDLRALMGEDYWPYGLAANRHVLDAFLTYSHEHGLSRRRLSPEDLFAPESLETTVV
jgi:4,5-dihydroxyphthalate decarboxylase